MNILALDLGTTTGLCYNIGDRVEMYSKTLATDAEIRLWGKNRLARRRDPRIKRLQDEIAGLDVLYANFDFIVFEDVEFSSSRKQCHLWASLRAAAWLAVDEHCTKFECVNVKTLKKFATGSGSADKTYMSAAMKAQFPELWRRDLDDNAIDAFWLHRWALKTLGRTPLDRTETPV